MVRLLSYVQDSKKLEKAWALDQRALFSPSRKQQQKLWDDSIEICKKLLQKYSTPSQDRYQILSKIALIYQHRMDFKNAKKSLDMIRNDSPNDPIMIFNYGNLYRAMNKPKSAIQYYKKAIRLAKNLSLGRDLFLSSLYQYKAILALKKHQEKD